MNGFEVYKIYLAVKLHFTSKNRSYDFHKHSGRTTARLGTFTKRRDRYFFHKLSKLYNDRDIADYFVSNFVTNTNLWVGDIIGRVGDENFKLWQKKIEALSYYFEQDIDPTILDASICGSNKTAPIEICGWDGTFNGKEYYSPYYIYTATGEVSTSDPSKNKEVIKSGTFILIK